MMKLRILRRGDYYSGTNVITTVLIRRDIRIRNRKCDDGNKDLSDAKKESQAKECT